jgi:hypothetical protein
VVGVVRTALAGAAAAGLLAVGYSRWGRAQQLTWGAAADEAGAVLPGDELVPRAVVQSTRAITIRATPAEVWPWVAQLGQGRGGFYSYDWMENLVGCRIVSADDIEPAWQDIAVGDDFRLHPDMALRVALVDPPQAFAAIGAEPAGQDLADPQVPFDMSWAFVLRPLGSDGTRLLVRERYDCRTTAAQILLEPLTAASFVMSRKMLQGIRDRAERPLAAPPLEARAAEPNHA